MNYGLLCFSDSYLFFRVRFSAKIHSFEVKLLILSIKLFYVFTVINFFFGDFTLLVI